MMLVKPSFEIMSIMEVVDGPDGMGVRSLELIERAGRTCYKSEGHITSGSAKNFAERILKSGHESVIEHSAMTVRFVIDRGVSHELVRHRLCAFSQESTRYCNYKGGVTFVIPPWIAPPPSWSEDIEYPAAEVFRCLSNRKTIRPEQYWLYSMAAAELSYLKLLDDGWTPQQARSVLTNSLKTEIVVTANFREWRHIFRLRTSPAAHPQMREVMTPLLSKVRELIPIIFDDIPY